MIPVTISFRGASGASPLLVYILIITWATAAPMDCSTRASAADVTEFGSQNALHIYFTMSQPSRAIRDSAALLLFNASCVSGNAFVNRTAIGGFEYTLVVWVRDSPPYSGTERMAYLAFDLYPSRAAEWWTLYSIDRIVPAFITTKGQVIDDGSTSDSTNNSAGSKTSSGTSSSSVVIAVAAVGVVVAIATVLGCCCVSNRRSSLTPVTAATTEMATAADRVRIALPSEVNHDHVVVAVAADETSSEAPLPPTSIVDGVACYGIPDSAYGPQFVTARVGYIPRGADDDDGQVVTENVLPPTTARLHEAGNQAAAQEGASRPSTTHSTTSSQRREAWVESNHAHEPMT